MATKTLDNDSATAWAGSVEDIARNQGDNVEITWTFFDVSIEKIKLLCIKNGHVGNGQTYIDNHRIKSAIIEGCRESAMKIKLKNYDASLTDLFDTEFRQYQTVPLSCTSDADAEGRAKLALRIKSTYPADDGSSQVAISDVRFFSGP